MLTAHPVVQDVAKTRIMLAKAGSEEARLGLLAVLRQVARDKGVPGLFAGQLLRKQL